MRNRKSIWQLKTTASENTLGLPLPIVIQFIFHYYVPDTTFFSPLNKYPDEPACGVGLRQGHL